MLAKYPEHQRKCQEEIDKILEGRDNDYVIWYFYTLFPTLLAIVAKIIFHNVKVCNGFMLRIPKLTIVVSGVHYEPLNSK